MKIKTNKFEGLVYGILCLISFGFVGCYRIVLTKAIKEAFE